MEQLDVVIVGAGPAGLRAAKILSEGGRKVVIFEKNPEVGHKICAGGLTSKIFDLGIPISLADKVFYSIKIHCFGRTHRIKRDKLLVATVSREKLGQWMVEQLNHRVEIMVNSETVEIKDDHLILKTGQRVGFNYLIGADGSLSVVRKHLGLKSKRMAIGMQYNIPQVLDELELFLDPKVFGSRYVWIFPHQKYTSVGCGYDLEEKREKVLENFQRVLRENNISIKGTELETHPINFDYQGFIFGNKFLIGDAGGFSFGLAGEGIYPAIVSGAEVARKILNPGYKCPRIKKLLAVKSIQEKWAKFLMFKLFRSKLLTKLILKRAV